MANKKLKIVNLTAGYPLKPVLQNLNFEINSGQLLVIAGPNGCGKTTLLKTMARLIKPLAGEIFYNDQNINFLNYQKTARIFGFLPQIEKFEENFTAEEFVTLGRYPWMKNFWNISSFDKKIVSDVFAFLEINYLKNSPVSQLSGGELQKVRLARVIAQTPEVLFLDEPTLHLDVKFQFSILTFLKKMIKDSILNGNPLLIIITLHDINQIIQFADRVILLFSGQVILDGHPEQVITPKIIKEIYNIDSIIEKLPKGNFPIFSPLIQI